MRILIAIALLWAQTARADLLINPFVFTPAPVGIFELAMDGSVELSMDGGSEVPMDGAGGGGGGASLSLIGTDTGGVAASGTLTWSGVSIGSAAADRVVCVVASFRSTANHSAGTMTIGGNAATVIAGKSTDATDHFHVYVGWAAVASGTTADVVISSASISIAWDHLSVYRMTGMSATARDSGTANGSAILSTTLVTTSGGYVIAGVCSNPTGPSITWSGGVTEDVDVNTTANDDTASAASGTATGASMTPKASITGGSSVYSVFAAASFQP